ncbi:MAG: STAS domain-containing protein [Prochloraceae cyanobacterium]|nr:STAS domain-containing protein [Prochloraceae cyanobacterium]
MNSTLELQKIATIEPSGHISAANVNEFQRQLSDIARSHQYSALLIDMSKVEFLDSAGLMVLVRAFREAQSLGRRLSICSVSPQVRIILELTQLDRVFEIFESRVAFESAVN